MINMRKIVVGTLVKEESKITGTIINKDAAGFVAKEIKNISGTGLFSIKVENSSYIKEIKLDLIEELANELREGLKNNYPVHIEGSLSGNSFVWSKIYVNGKDINLI